MDLELMKVKQQLKERFLSVIPDNTSELAVDMFWGELIGQYDDPRRYYHNLYHLNYVFYWIENVIGDDLSAEVIFAVLYHDFYLEEKMFQSPEQRSAEKCAEVMGDLGYPVSMIIKAYHYIVHTAYHTYYIGGLDPMTKLFLDSDLVILASSRNDYERYAENIYKEVRGFDNNVSRITYIIKRMDFLKKMLETEHIFYDLDGISEEQAFNNCFNELNKLRVELHQYK